MKISKRQLKRIIREEKSRLLSEAAHPGVLSDPLELQYAIQEKLEYELLVDIQNQIQKSLTPAQRRLVDLGREAETMGFEDLMEQVQNWFDNYISQMLNR